MFLTKSVRSQQSEVKEEAQKEAPDSNPDGRALEAEPDGPEVEDLC